MQFISTEPSEGAIVSAFKHGKITKVKYRDITSKLNVPEAAIKLIKHKRLKFSKHNSP